MYGYWWMLILPQGEKKITLSCLHLFIPQSSWAALSPRSNDCACAKMVSEQTCFSGTFAHWSVIIVAFSPQRQRQRKRQRATLTVCLHDPNLHQSSFSLCRSQAQNVNRQGEVEREERRGEDEAKHHSLAYIRCVRPTDCK